MTLPGVNIFEKLFLRQSSPVFVIAEVGVNHNGDVELARRLIRAAARAGADAVKFQTFSASKLVAEEAKLAPYQESACGGQRQHQMLSSLELSSHELTELRDVCQEEGVVFSSTPFDEESVDLLRDLGVPFFKVSSPDITYFPLLEKIAATRLPIILSTGLATMEEIGAALTCIRKAGNEQVILLHCVTEYPAPLSSLNLKAIQSLSAEFRVPVGYSDHSEGILAATTACALGARVIEKHLTLDKNLPGPDHQASAEPDELAELIRQIRGLEIALGDGTKRPVECEEKNRIPARRSVFLKSSMEEGDALSAESLLYLRPGDGIPPTEYRTLIGRRLKRDLPKGYKLSWEDLV